MRRRALLSLPLLAAPLALAIGGCGFHPLHGGETGPVMAAELAAIEITTPLDETGQNLKIFLTDDLNPGGFDEVDRYELVITLRRTRNALGIQLSDSITRYDLILAAFYQLKRKDDGAVLYQSAVRRVSSYNVERAPFATQVAQQDAERRAAQELSHDIALKLGLYFRGKTT
jgi:LPS-assembly lipoprotein